MDPHRPSAGDALIGQNTSEESPRQHAGGSFVDALRDPDAVPRCRIVSHGPQLMP